MGHFICIFLLFLNFAFPCEVASSSTNHLCPQDQSSALLEFKDMFAIQSDASPGCHSSYPKTLSWNNSDCCSWDGVTCDIAMGHVIELDLSCSQLGATVNLNSSNSLLHLTHLQRLNLAHNFVNDYIPSWFGRFPYLTHINLSYSVFVGPIPPEIFFLSKLISLDFSGGIVFLETSDIKLMKNLTHLEELILEDTPMFLTIPGSLMNMTSLAIIDLSYNQLQGNLPGQIFLLPNLRELHLYRCFLTSVFPDLSSINGSSLEHLNLAENNISGELPGSILNLKSLHFLDISKSRGLRGELPSSIGNLKSLSHVDLSFTKLTGQLPYSIGNLKSLSILDFTGTKLTGELPDSIGKLKSLQRLNAYNTNLRGKLPGSIGNLKSLRALDVSYTQMTGELPDSIGGLESLRYLNLEGCNFSGVIPPSIGSLTQITELHFSGNNFNGQLPNEISNLKQIVSLLLSNNRLTGEIPRNLGKLKKLEEVDISENALTGHLPSSASGLKNLQALWLGNNKLNGTLPPWIFTIPSLKFLNLSFNQLTSEIHDFRYGSSLETIDLSNNQLQGSVPGSVKNAVYLTTLSLSHNNFSNILEPHVFSDLTLDVLDLSHNRLQGSFPIPPASLSHFVISHNKFTGGMSKICNLEDPETLDLGYNDLEGAIPQCLSKFFGLCVLDLQKNKINGTIPPIFQENSPLITLNLNGNQLEGPLPKSLAYCVQLELLDLGNNRLNGSFPHWLESFPELQVLVLNSNKFYGPIRNSRTKNPFPNIRVFDISDNEFTGLLPVRYFKSFTAMRNANETEKQPAYMGDSDGYDDSIVLVWKGFEVEFQHILITLTTIDLSANRFEGEIPEAIQELNSLRLLNLSHNSLTGHIPSSLAKVSKLESLDLSSNELVGLIPPELASLTSLVIFNVSLNHLIGPIPKGKQFNTFENNSYVGNLGLCGFPLSSTCGGNNKPPQQKVTLQKEDPSVFSRGLTWEVVLFGYGCGVPCGLVMGFLMLFFGRPIWLARIVEMVHHWKVKRPKTRGHLRRERRNNR